jgi:predicted HD phosphohydrolase
MTHMLAPTPEYFIELYSRQGHVAYAGEPVVHLAHAWQCGQLALYAEASPHLQLACWLHDLGHLLGPEGLTPTLEGHNDQHELVGADLIESLWGPLVAEPVRLHVQAKRYLVKRNPHYLDRLSEDSRRSLALQGGAMTDAECAAFECSPHHKPALLLRVWDEQAKQAGWFARSANAALAQLRLVMSQVPLLSVPRSAMVSSAGVGVTYLP